VRDERVIVDRGNGMTQILEHAHACGPYTIGGGIPGEPPCDCASTCKLADMDDVRVRRVSVWRTAGVVTAVAVGTGFVAGVVAFGVSLGSLNLGWIGVGI
jgi:hypothetical protein